MTHSRVALLAVALLIGPVTGAVAQMIVGPTPGPAPGPVMGPGPGSGMTVSPAPGSGMTVGPGPGPGPMTVGPGPGPGPMTGPAMTPSAGGGNMPPCMSQFLPMRAEAEKRAGVLQAGINHKKPRPELCQLFRSFSDAEEKVVKFAAANQTGCGIPPDAVATMKKNHAKTAEVRDKVCAEGPKPAGPNLGEALGMRNLPSAETTKAGTGTLDSLSGNPLAR
jgi:hypothetical protein